MNKVTSIDWNNIDPSKIDPAEVNAMSKEEFERLVEAYDRQVCAKDDAAAQILYERRVAESKEKLRVLGLPPSGLLRLMTALSYFLSLIVPGSAYIQSEIYFKLYPERKQGAQGHYIGYHRHLATTTTILPSVWVLSILLMMRGAAHINSMIMSAWFLSSVVMLVFGIPLLVVFLKGVSMASSGRPVNLS